MTEKKLYVILMKMMIFFIIIKFTRMENEQWKELRLLKLVTFAKAQRTVAVANARHPASPLARLVAVLLISSVKTQRNKSLEMNGNAAGKAAFFSFEKEKTNGTSI